MTLIPNRRADSSTRSGRVTYGLLGLAALGCGLFAASASSFTIPNHGARSCCWLEIQSAEPMPPDQEMMLLQILAYRDDLESQEIALIESLLTRNQRLNEVQLAVLSDFLRAKQAALGERPLNDQNRQRAANEADPPADDGPDVMRNAPAPELPRYLFYPATPPHPL